jgi:hypothetical protein
MTPIKHFYPAIFTIIFFNIFLIPSSFASLLELKEKEDEKHSKKPAALTLKAFEKKFGPLLIYPNKYPAVCQDPEKYTKWIKKHGVKRNFAIYRIACNKQCTFFVKQGKILKLSLNKGDEFLAVLPLGKYTFATAPSKTVLPAPKGFTSKALTIGDLRGDVEEEDSD